MNSLLIIIYLLSSIPCGIFLCISFFIAGLISVSIIVRQSRPDRQIELEASFSSVVPRFDDELPPPTLHDLDDVPQNEAQQDLQPATTAVEDESEHNGDDTSFLPPPSSDTSASIHNTPPPNIQPLQAVVIVSQQDLLTEIGSRFANGNDISYGPISLPQYHDLDSDGNTS